MEVYGFVVTKEKEITWIQDRESREIVSKVLDTIKNKSIEMITTPTVIYVVSYTHSKDLYSIMKAYGKLIRFLDSKFPGGCNVVIGNIKGIKRELVYEFVSIARYRFVSNHRELVDIEIIDEKLNPVCYKDIDGLMELIYEARDLVNLSTHKKSPLEIIGKIRERAEKINCVNIQVISGEDLKEYNLNLIYEVGKGSNNEPAFIILEYLPKKDKNIDVALIGKGVLFDTGGYNLKTKLIDWMKMDTAGGIAAIYSFLSLASSGVPINMVCAVPFVENLISGRAYKPSDIVKSYSGKTVEVVNTDAEGRLILADAISYVDKKYSPNEMIDLATLTGAVIIALGKDIAGIMGDEDIVNPLIDLGEEIGEFLWELPMKEALFEDAFKSEVADLRNLPKDPWAGPIIGGMFIKQFISNAKKWAHIDIAGTAYTPSSHLIYWAGATGFGIRLLYYYVMRKVR